MRQHENSCIKKPRPCVIGIIHGNCEFQKPLGDMLEHAKVSHQENVLDEPTIKINLHVEIIERYMFSYAGDVYIMDLLYNISKGLSSFHLLGEMVYADESRYYGVCCVGLKLDIKRKLIYIIAQNITNNVKLSVYFYFTNSKILQSNIYLIQCQSLMNDENAFDKCKCFSYENLMKSSLIFRINSS